MKRRTVLASIGAVVASILVKCLANPARAVGRTHHRVMITDFEFVPSTLTVRVGDPVTWVNLDIAPHTATARDKTRDTKRLKLNLEETIEVQSGMTTDYFRRFHPMMKANLRIVEG